MLLLFRRFPLQLWLIAPFASTILAGLLQQAIGDDEPRSLYTYSFGGMENMKVKGAVSMLDRLGYAGIAAGGGRSQPNRLPRLKQYVNWSNSKGNNFQVFATYVAHKFPKYGFDIQGHKDAIDAIAKQKGATTNSIWCWFQPGDQADSITDEQIENFVRRIYNYAKSKGIKMILYPHYGTWFPSVDDALPLVEKIDDPTWFGIALSLHHERQSEKDGVLEQTFNKAKKYLSAVIISGGSQEIDWTSRATMTASVIQPLDKSEYDLRPFMRLIRDSGFKGPVGFINFKLKNPENYLKSSIAEWKRLCNEVGLFDPPRPEPLKMNQCIQKFFTNCMPQVCNTESTLEKTLRACKAKSPKLTYKCVQRAGNGCRAAAGKANPYFCTLMFEGHRKKKINKAICKAFKNKCQKVPRNACK